MAHDTLRMIEYADKPAVLIFGDSEAALNRGRRTAELAQCRVAAAEMAARASARLERHAAAPAIFVDLGEATQGEAATALLDRIRIEAEGHDRRSVVVAHPAIMDLVAARSWHPAIELLCAPDELQRVSAMARAARPHAPRLHDVGRESNALLQQLTEEMGRIATILASLSEEEAAELSAPRPAPPREADEPPIDAAYVRSLIRARRLRDQYFRGELFADPAWDMLLDLMAARLEGDRVAVSSLCIAAAVPATTALRWIKALTDRGLFVRSADPEDGRRVYIELADETAHSLAAYLRAVQRIAQTVI
ncbi:MAG TPA: winged helix DNA-binding protein [Allosphingosinicella sp.]|nr:winged helix DNA-binding protein [Allosphingosinicella sp.]